MSKEPVVEVTLRVRYAETDAMGIVHHTNYIVWFEAGRGEYMRQRGDGYAHLETQGYYLPVIEVQARYLAPARYADLVTVKTRVEEARSRQVTFAYEVVMAETDQLLATGRTKHFCVDEEGAIKTIPQAMRELLRTEVLI
ncbi:MAG: acyl-CoA thioesterase [Anaerolineae bacterium]|nr:acyl-CoA thioesterase [Anaerolineae bacterium]